MKDKTIVMLACQNESTNIVYNALKNNFKIDKVIIERRMPKFLFLKKRLKKFGFLNALGQAAFQSMAVPYLKMTSSRRILELKQLHQLDDSRIDKSKIINVKSSNSDEAIAILKKINPCLVIVNGTHIISERVLNAISAKFINMHWGITPLYRGMYGAYWALIENNKNSCGVTIHFLDAGIDTGNILEQEIINPTGEDNIITYGLLQLAAGIPLLKKTIERICEGRIEIKPYPKGASRLWGHPTLWEYIWHRICYNVK